MNKHIRSSTSSTLFLALGFLLLLTQDAHAYLDPGTGSLIFQMLVGAILAVGMVGKLYWRKLKDFFSRTPKQTPETEAVETSVKPLEAGKLDDNATSRT